MINIILQFRSRVTPLAAILVVSLCASTPGCERSTLEPETPSITPAIRRVSVASNSNNNLSATVTILTNTSGVAAVDILSEGVLERTTPFARLSRDSAVVTVFGLLPQRTFTMRALVTATSGSVSSSRPFQFTTQSVPGGIPQFKVLTSNSPTVRFVMLGITPANGGKSYAVIIDTGGNPVWYKEFKDAVVDFQKQANGRYTAWSSTDGSPSHFYEFDNLGAITNEFRATNGLQTDPHELRMRGNDYALFGLQFRTMDLSGVGGLSNAAVQDFVVEYHRAGHAPLLWNCFDHFAVSEAMPDISLKGQNVDPWHGNAIEIDLDGNLLVSYRNMDQITKVNSQTGEIIWRLGGKKNEFTFRNDNLNGFSHQHGIRRLENGHIILFDDGNLHSPPASRAVEYRLDEVNKVAELVWEYRPDPPIFGPALGFAQRLSNGNTLICFGTAQRIIEVGRDGTKRWDIVVNESQRYAYRAIAVNSLY